MERQSVCILGATGSIGDSTLDLIRHHKDRYDVHVLTAGHNVDKLIKLVHEFSPKYVAMADDIYHSQLKESCPNIEILSIDDAAMVPVDITMAAIVGMAGLTPTMNAIRQGNKVAFASKECLVSAGDIMMNEVTKCGTSFLPTDSEHNAIFQVFDNTQRDQINRLILTASGGPFRTASWEEMERATFDQALKHPTWSMGAKITIDSASLMNKALEVIEAHYLFDMPSDKIDVIIHPQSLIHSCVEYTDGSILSQMGPSDMRTPIAHCLAWPNRMETSGDLLDFAKVSQLTFEQPDIEKFKSLKMVRDVLDEGQGACIIFNAANEIANKAFINGQIGFTHIYDVIDFALETTQRATISSLDDVIHYDELVRRIATEKVNNSQ